MIKLHDLIKAQIQYRASDLILKVNSPPIMRVNGDLRLLDLPALNKVDIETGLIELLSKKQVEEYKKMFELDFSYAMPTGERFRINLFKQKGNLGGVFRLIPPKVPTLKEIGFSEGIEELSLRPRGLIVVTGPSGCGKSTTQAALLDHRNTNDTCHIVTVEDPVEFIHQSKKALVSRTLFSWVR